MKKRFIYSTIGAVSAGAAALLLKDEQRREKVKQKAKSLTESVQGSLKNEHNNDLPVEKAGVPEFDSIENTKMVDEGSQFGVQYYNEVKDDEDPEEIQRKQNA
ncbi:hypothetical protein GLW08_02260 [Pontibacillus yanchengensis]|uniref:YtxH domain-containing protein n=2 Tax=Pontibacillus yanchengensis TaxID=462910 RepID=A0A6I4ZYU3_9BACI|nr:hypothetical protein [Pontibacillus yanchengensis]MYL32993.1 hypothetical protein [Pontibacillus yanchengensis]MYL52157.1 hypothetical protein [Pontibacillus yanchengensis]